MLSAKAPRERRGLRIASRQALRVAQAGAAAAVAAALGLGGCGGAGGSSSSPQAGELPNSLKVTLDVDGAGGRAPQSSTISCPSDACKVAEGVSPKELEPVPPTQACTMIFGGPEVVTAKGTLNGTTIDVSLNRRNGCEIERFNAFLPVVKALFPDYEPGGAIAG